VGFFLYFFLYYNNQKCDGVVFYGFRYTMYVVLLKVQLTMFLGTRITCYASL